MSHFYSGSFWNQEEQSIQFKDRTNPGVDQTLLFFLKDCFDNISQNYFDYCYIMHCKV